MRALHPHILVPGERGGSRPRSGTYYAHCLKRQPGVTLLVAYTAYLASPRAHHILATQAAAAHGACYRATANDRLLSRGCGDPCNDPAHHHHWGIHRDDRCLICRSFAGAHMPLTAPPGRSDFDPEAGAFSWTGLQGPCIYNLRVNAIRGPPHAIWLDHKAFAAYTHQTPPLGFPREGPSVQLDTNLWIAAICPNVSMSETLELSSGRARKRSQTQRVRRHRSLRMIPRVHCGRRLPGGRGQFLSVGVPSPCEFRLS